MCAVPVKASSRHWAMAAGGERRAPARAAAAVRGRAITVDDGIFRRGATATGRGLTCCRSRTYSADSAGRTIMASSITANVRQMQVVVRSWRPNYNLYR